MVPITKTCDTCKHFYNDKHCVGCKWDKGTKENTKWELEDNSIVIERAVLDKIKAEIKKAIWEDVVVSLDGTDEIRIPRLDPDDVFEIIDKYKTES